jgi:SAM-dependent methyltransferase
MTESWHHGYYTDAGYTFGQYRETTPSHLAWAAALKGHRAPLSAFRYIDLGCGQGFNLSLIAAAFPDSEFVGVDFMPEHIAHARSLAEAAGLRNVRFIEGDFVELAQSPQMLGDDASGSFDYAVAHGIYTWVGDSVRAALLKLAGALLKAGGLMYNGYNTFPGWLSAMPLQHLVSLQQGRGHGGSAAIERALSILQKLDDAGAVTMKAQPGLRARLQSAKKQSASYLVHEYNTRAWMPVFAAPTLESAAASKMDFLGSATLPELFDNLLTKDARELLGEQPDVPMRESVRDLVLGQSFRRDIYVKGRPAAWQTDIGSDIKDWRFVAPGLVAPPKDTESFEFATALGKLKGNRAQYLQIVELADSGIALQDMLTQQQGTRSASDVLQMVSLLVHGGWLHFQRLPNAAEQESAHRFNRLIAASVLKGAPYSAFLSPTSTIVTLSPIEMLIVSRLLLGKATSPNAGSIASALSEDLRRLGRSLQSKQNGESVDAKEEALRLATIFQKKRLPALARLGLVES